MPGVRNAQSRHGGSVFPLRQTYAIGGGPSACREGSGCGTALLPQVPQGTSGGEQILRFLRHAAAGSRPTRPAQARGRAERADAGGHSSTGA